MTLTTTKIQAGYYKVNEIEQDTYISKSMDEENLWMVSCDELNVLSKWGNKKQCLSYLHSVIFECNNYEGYKLNSN
jgi:hypothetical protein